MHFKKERISSHVAKVCFSIRKEVVGLEVPKAHNAYSRVALEIDDEGLVDYDFGSVIERRSGTSHIYVSFTSGESMVAADQALDRFIAHLKSHPEWYQPEEFIL